MAVKMCLVILLLFYDTTIADVIASTTAFNASYICSLLVKGTKIKDPRTCNSWIQCAGDDEPIAGECINGYYYDREKMDCVPKESIECISGNPCAIVSSAESVVVADPYSCNGYIVCNNGTGSKGECPNGMNYNPGTLSCISNFPCVKEMNPYSYCNILPDGVFIRNPNNCNGYQLCWEGHILNGTCPENFYYNSKTGYCDYPETVDCIEMNQTYTLNPLHVCEEAGNFISDNRTCNGYYFCYQISDGNFELLHEFCPSGRFFTTMNNGTCVARTEVPCTFDPCAGYGKLGIQLSNLSGDGCHGYAICQNGVSIGTGKCPQNEEYFDEINQRCTEEKINYPTCTADALS